MVFLFKVVDGTTIYMDGDLLTIDSSPPVMDSTPPGAIRPTVSQSAAVPSATEINNRSPPEIESSVLSPDQQVGLFFVTGHESTADRQTDPQAVLRSRDFLAGAGSGLKVRLQLR